MFGQPLSLQCVFIHIVCQFSQQNEKKRVHWQINRTASLKNSTDVCARFSTMLLPSSWIVFVWRQIEWIIQTMSFPIGNLQWSVEAIGADNGGHTEVHLWITVTCEEYLLDINFIASLLSNIVPHVTGLWHFVILQLQQQTFYNFFPSKAYQMPMIRDLQQFAFCTFVICTLHSVEHSRCL